MTSSFFFCMVPLRAGLSRELLGERFSQVHNHTLPHLVLALVQNLQHPKGITQMKLQLNSLLWCDQLIVEGFKVASLCHGGRKLVSINSRCLDTLSLVLDK